MKQFFECSNLECKYKTKEQGNMRMKNLYEKIAEDGVEVNHINNTTAVICPECGDEMVYVSIG